ncbi:hypothetical protein [Leucobacter sp. USHLN153]|uniref:hypothetical protein n=1 Tax=Leucobacter sp. USHLN153 TaxID=3081268 RepID=UPI00301699C6
MDILLGVLIVVHIVAFGAVFGATLSQFPAARVGAARVTPGILHGTSLLFASGLFLVAAASLAGRHLNVGILAAKTLVLIVMVVLILVNRRKPRVAPSVLGAIAALSLVNVALAIFGG